MKFFLYIILFLLFVSGLNGQTLTFILEKNELDNSGINIPLIEGWVHFKKSSKEALRNIPKGLSKIEYTSIQVSNAKDSLITGIKGLDKEGNLLYYFDKNNDEDFSNDSLIIFKKEKGIDVARFSIDYDQKINNILKKRQTVLALYQRKPGKLEFHLNELWKTILVFKNEKLPIVIQKFPPDQAFVFIDNNYSGKYEKMFFVKKEVLGIGGKFFKLNINFSKSVATLLETEKSPVDKGYPAPEFTAECWKSKKRISISDQNEKTTLLTFWSPYCSGSVAEVKLYNKLKNNQYKDFINFIAVPLDPKNLADSLKKTDHSYDQIIKKSLWDLYGVTSPFATFIIDKKGIIVNRFFGYSKKIEEELKRLYMEFNQ